MKHAPIVVLTGVLLGGLMPSLAAAQGGPVPRPTGRGPLAELRAREILRKDLAGPYEGNAEETRRQLGEVFRQYPPSLGLVLRLDPSLLTNAEYLEPYPALAAFLSAHPEVAHNPGFFLGQFREIGFTRNTDDDSRAAVIRSMAEGLFPVAFLIGFVTVVGTIGWLVRSAIDHRRWLRMSKIQTDAHTKLLDRLTSNEDLMAYVQSAAGRRFLTAAPISLSGPASVLTAPLGRILWSVQAGCVIAFLGLGLVYSSRRVAASPTFGDIGLPIFVMGATALAIGAGFVISAVVAYALSHRLGLLTAPPPPADAEPDAGGLP